MPPRKDSNRLVTGLGTLGRTRPTPARERALLERLGTDVGSAGGEPGCHVEPKRHRSRARVAAVVAQPAANGQLQGGCRACAEIAPGALVENRHGPVHSGGEDFSGRLSAYRDTTLVDYVRGSSRSRDDTVSPLPPIPMSRSIRPGLPCDLSGWGVTRGPARSATVHRR